MDNLKLIISYMTLKELKRVEAIIKRMIKAKEAQRELIRNILK